MHKKENDTQQKDSQKQAVSFLLAEYAQLNQEFQRLRGEGLNRLNFFIAITSSVLGGLVFLTQSGKASGIFLQIVAIGALFFLVLIGWDTFRFTISRDVGTDENLRRIARIRRFFAEDYPPIVKHLAWQTHDEPTNWVKKNSSGIRQTAQSIMSLLFALIIIILVSLVTNQPILLGASGIISFVLAYTFLRLYASKKYKAAAVSAKKERKFPDDTEG